MTKVGYIPYNGSIITRKHARSNGLPKYFTGKPCKRGHISERFTSCKKCLQCNNEKSSIRYYEKHAEVRAYHNKRYADNPQLGASYTKKWRQQNPERVAELSKRWRKENPDLARASQKRYDAKFPERRKAKDRAWTKNNPDKAKAKNHRRIALKRGAEGSYTADDIAKIRLAQKDRCAVCRTKLKGKGDVDHIHPLSKGGSNWPRNLQLLCVSCNAKKHTTDPIVFMQRQGFLL